MPDRTRKLILNAFNELIEKTDFQTLTVEAICKEAEVSRTTFYRYFKDKYDVMTFNYELLFEQYITAEDIETAEDFFVAMFRATKENFQPLIKAYEVLGTNSMTDVIYKISVNYLIAYWSLRKGEPINDVERMQCDVFAKGISYNGHNWISGEYDITPEQAGTAAYEMLPAALQGPLWKML